MITIFIFSTAFNIIPHTSSTALSTLACTQYCSCTSQTHNTAQNRGCRHSYLWGAELAGVHGLGLIEGEHGVGEDLVLLDLFSSGGIELVLLDSISPFSWRYFKSSVIVQSLQFSFPFSSDNF